MYVFDFPPFFHIFVWYEKTYAFISEDNDDRWELIQM